MPLPIATIRQFNKNVLTLATGTSLAQAIPLLVAPLLTRLYTPTDFGLLATFMALASFIAIAATGRYEFAIVLPRSDSDANALVTLILFATGVTVALTTFLMLVWSGSIADALEHPEISKWLIFVPVSVGLVAIFNTLNFWQNRQKRYKLMGAAKVTQSSVSSFYQLLAGLVSPSAGTMISGAMLGQFFSTAALAKSYIKQSIAMDNWWEWGKIKAAAHLYRKHPSHLLPAGLLGTAALQLPIYILLSTHGAAAVGLYALANRVVLLPVALVAEAIGQVYRQQASEDFRTGNGFRKLFLYTVIRSAGIALLPSMFLFLFSPVLMEFVFGKNWAAAGPIVQIIVISAFFQFVVVPIDNGALIVGATWFSLLWQSTRFVLLSIFAIYSQVVDMSLHSIVWGLTLINIVLYLVNGIAQYKFSNYRDRLL